MTQPTYPPMPQSPSYAPYASPGMPTSYPPLGMPGGDQFGAPTHVVNVIRPRIMDIGVGRLLLISPVKIERGVKNDLSDDPSAVQDRLTADVVALDGPPFPYGGKPEQGVPHTHTANPPQEWQGLWLTQDLIVRQCERMVGGKVLGRLVQGQASKPGRRPPWRLDDPTEADKQLARQYLAGVVVAAAAPPAPTPSPAVSPAGFPYATAPAPVSAAPPAPVWNPTTGQWEFPPAPLAGQPNPSPQPAAYAPPPAVAAPALDINTPPAGMDPALWASMPAEYRTAILFSQATTPPPWQ